MTHRDRQRQQRRGQRHQLRRLRAGFKLEHAALLGVGCLPVVPQARHPFADHARSSRLRGRHAGRHAALRDHDQPVADLEQLVELLADDQQRAARVAQLEQLAADQRRRADVDAPGRLADDQQLRVGVDLAPDDELLQVAARQALGRRAGAAGLDVEAVDDVLGQQRARACVDIQPLPEHRLRCA